MFSLTIEDNNGRIAEQFTFDHGSYLIGRQENCDIVLPSTSVSRKHAKIFVESGRCYIEDLNSANGVTVDGQRVAEQRHLGTAAQIRIGDYYLYLEYTGEGELAGDNRDTLYIADDADHNKLVRVNDEFAGEEFKLSEVKNTIGRTDDNFILLSDPSISREHAVIHRDGDRYVLSDRGSSNGTRVNGRDISKPTDLDPGDLVEFGNVQFVFAHGNEDVDPSDYKTSSVGEGGLLIAAVVTVVLVVAVVAAGLLVYGFASFPGTGSSKVSATSGESVESDSEVGALMKRGRDLLKGGEWKRAIEVFNEVLARSPGHEKAKSLRARARRSREAAESLAEGRKQRERGEHHQALQTLRDIPEDTPAHDEAQPELRELQKKVAADLQREAQRVLESSDGNLEAAREKLERAIQLAPTDSEVYEQSETTLGRVNRELKR